MKLIKQSLERDLVHKVICYHRNMFYFYNRNRKYARFVDYARIAISQKTKDALNKINNEVIRPESDIKTIEGIKIIIDNNIPFGEFELYLKQDITQEVNEI